VATTKEKVLKKKKDMGKRIKGTKNRFSWGGKKPSGSIINEVSDMRKE